VVRVGDHYAVKFGGTTSLQEGENMLFIQQSTSIPIPKVYALFRDRDTNLEFIVMEYISGTDLRAVWGTLDTTKKRAIASQLRQQIDEVRRIPSPGYYGGVWGKPIRNFLFNNEHQPNQPHPEPEISGPHKTEEQWVEAMCRRLGKLKGAAPRQISFLRRHYHAVFRGHEPVFTHANLCPGNVMLRHDGTPVMIDWEDAGWYPSFWEYCCAAVLFGHASDWDELVYDMLGDHYAAELGWMAHHHTALVT
jgi:aminoglycoside phosphotransferase (APT) family kinase protein